MSTSSKTIVQLPEFRNAMKELGYKVSIKTNSSFKTATVKLDGKAINAGNVLTEEHLKTHQAFYDYREAHSVRDGEWIVTI